MLLENFFEVTVANKSRFGSPTFEASKQFSALPL
jgi:hypothetical protein